MLSPASSSLPSCLRPGRSAGTCHLSSIGRSAGTCHLSSIGRSAGSCHLSSIGRSAGTCHLSSIGRSAGTCHLSSIATTCKTQPAARVRPMTLFGPAREMFLNYNENRPAVCHRPPLHYTIDGLSCLPLHRLKTNVITTFIFFDNALLNARWIVWILISNDIISVDRSFHLRSDARW